MATTYTYSAFGINISSEIKIPEFIPSSGDIQVTVSYGEVPKKLDEKIINGFRFQISADEFIIRYKPWAAFYVCNGNKIIIQPEKDADENDIKTFLISSVIVMLLHQRGLLPLHASGIKVDNKAVLFAANAGVGKSTIALDLNRKYGYPLIADDVTVVSAINNLPVVYSSFPSAKLWQDSIEMLGLLNKDLPFIRKDVFKYRFDNRPAFFSGILEPLLIFVIENGDKENIEIQEIKGVDKFNVLRQHIFRAKMINEIYAVEHFKILTQLLKSVSCFKILKHNNSNTLNELSVTIQDTIKQW